MVIHLWLDLKLIVTTMAKQYKQLFYLTLQAFLCIKTHLNPQLPYGLCITIIYFTKKVIQYR